MELGESQILHAKGRFGEIKPSGSLVVFIPKCLRGKQCICIL